MECLNLRLALGSLGSLRLGIKSTDTTEVSCSGASIPIPGAPMMSTVSFDKSHDNECFCEGGSHATAVVAGSARRERGTKQTNSRLLFGVQYG